MRHDLTSSRAGRAAARDAGLERERRRLRRAFSALLVALAPAAAAEACTGPGTSPGTGGGSAGADAGADAEDHGEDARPPEDADAAPPDAGSDVSCDLAFFDIDAGLDAEALCIIVLPCGLGPDLGVIDCVVYEEAGPLGCNVLQGTPGCNEAGAVPANPGAVQLYCPDCLGSGGRRPAGLVRPRALERRGQGSIGAHFARAAHDEAASVPAFRRLREELARNGAPRALVRAAERAARDEVRHARVMADRARAAGAPVVAPVVRRRGPRSLEAMARENSVEGCVLETFAALTAAWQAAHARDASLRRTFARIAQDETRHAALSWAVARWAEDRLSPEARARVAAARARAVRALGAAASSCPRGPRSASPAAVRAELGTPSPVERALLFEGMTRRLGLAAERAERVREGVSIHGRAS